MQSHAHTVLSLSATLTGFGSCSSSDTDYGRFAPTVYGNLALVYFKLRRYRKAEGACSVGIQVVRTPARVAWTLV